MKKAILFFITGTGIAYVAARLQLDIYVVLSGICIAAGSLTYGYLLIVKKQYERMVSDGKFSAAEASTITRPAA